MMLSKGVGIRAGGPEADLGQTHVERLLERIAAVLPSEHEGRAHPTHQVRLLVGKCQVSLAQELGVSAQCGLQAFIAHGYNRTP